MNVSDEEIATVDCNGTVSAEANCTPAEPTGLTPSYPDYTRWLQFSISTQFILIFIIFFTNATVLVLIARCERLRVMENSFVASMAAADLLLSLAMIPGVHVTLYPAEQSGKYACLLLWCSIMFSSSASNFSLLGLSLDRYLKIVHPLRPYMTTRRACGILAFAWLYTFVTALFLPFVGVNNIKSPDFVCFDFKEVFNIAHLQYYCYVNGLAPFVVMFVMYGKIFAVVLDKLRADVDHRPAGVAQGSGPSSSSGAGGADNPAAQNKQWIRREFKVVKKLTMVLGTTTVAWVPTTCMLLRQIYEPTYIPTFETRVILSSLTYINSAVNPLLYSLRMQPFREELSRVFGRRHGRRNAVYPA